MSVQNISDVTVTSLETINAFDITTGNYLFTLDELQNVTIAQTEDKSEITGKHGRKLSNLKRNKAVTISGSNGMVSGGLLEMQTGGSFEHKVTDVMWTDYLTVSAAHKAKTNYRAIGTTGAEIEALYLKNSNGTLGEPLEQNGSAEKGKFKYDPETKDLEFDTSVLAGTEIVVYYKRQIAADVLTNDTETFSKKCSLYIDAFGEDKCANVFRIQFYIPKADFNGEFSLEMGENQTVHEFETESLAGSCGEGAANGMLWTYTVFGAETSDVKAGAEAADEYGQEDKVRGEHKASELIDKDCHIEWDGIHGEVIGKLNYITDGAAFGPKISEKHYCFPLVLDDSYKNRPVTIKRTSGEGDEATDDTETSNSWVLGLTDLAETTYEIYCEDVLIATLGFSGATFAQATEAA